MNLREGTRRLALLLGGLGIIVGGFASYLFLQPALEQRARHSRFEQLANSDVVKQERKTLQATPDFIPDDPIQDFIALSTPEQLEEFRQLSQEKQTKLLNEVRSRSSRKPAKTYLDDQGNPIPSPRPVAPGTSSTQNEQSVPGFGPPEEPKDWEVVDKTGKPELSQVSKGGIKTIHWTKSFGVESIETEDGLTLYPTPAPGAWSYVLIAILPVLGFFIPWGAIRAIGWVGTGFTASAR